MIVTDAANSMISYFRGDGRRINHFLKVYSFAKTIGESEHLDSDTQEILEVTALMHDIGIKISEEKYNSSAGKYQEIEGPAPAREILTALGYDPDKIQRVCYLIAHHHTYNQIDGLDYQILVEADFLVNTFEESSSIDSIKTVRERIFKTESGKQMLDNLYAL